MTVSELYAEWYNITEGARKEKLQRLFDHLLNDVKKNDDVLLDILDTVEIYEDDDYFGTEGVKL